MNNNDKSANSGQKCQAGDAERIESSLEEVSDTVVKEINISKGSQIIISIPNA